MWLAGLETIRSGAGVLVYIMDSNGTARLERLRRIMVCAQSRAIPACVSFPVYSKVQTLEQADAADATAATAHCPLLSIPHEFLEPDTPSTLWREIRK